MTAGDPRDSTNLDGYGNAALPWERVLRNVIGGPDGPDATWFLGVIDPDWSPHAAGLAPLWDEGQPYFVSGPGTRKSRALAQRPSATLSARFADMDLVFEGTAE